MAGGDPRDAGTIGVDVAVVGSGALATAVCDGLAVRGRAAATGGPLRVAVLARDPAAAGRLAVAAGIRAAVTRAGVGPAVRFAGRPLDHLHTGAVRPAVLVVCASHQSPYEALTRPSAWTSLLRDGGFGLALALQALLSYDLARAVTRHSPQAAIVNGCFPDAVNPLLRALDTPVTCGIGNVATVAAALRSTLDGAPAPLRVLAHHVHLAPPASGGAEALAWTGDELVSDVTARLAAARDLPRARLNDLGALVAADVVLALLGDRPVAGHAPGPLGLPGGYPVTLAARTVALDLPAGLSPAEAVGWNRRAGQPDGVSIDDGRVTHTDRAAAALERHLPALAAGWPVDALPDVCRRLLALRETLRTRPPDPAHTGPSVRPLHPTSSAADRPTPAAPAGRPPLTVPPHR